jgi:hypothetical protein
LLVFKKQDDYQSCVPGTLFSASKRSTHGRQARFTSLPRASAEILFTRLESLALIKGGAEIVSTVDYVLLWRDLHGHKEMSSNQPDTSGMIQNFSSAG